MERIVEIVDHGGLEGWHSYSYGEAREEIVRCGACENCIVQRGELACMGPLTTSWDYYADQPQVTPVPPDGFCAWGKRRENED